jgi:hypothetical protein
MRYQVPHSYKTTSEIIVFYNLTFKYLETRDGETKGPELNGSQHSPNLICPSFLRECNFDVNVVPKYMNFVTFSIDLSAINNYDFVLHFGYET